MDHSLSAPLHFFPLLIIRETHATPFLNPLVLGWIPCRSWQTRTFFFNRHQFLSCNSVVDYLFTKGSSAASRPTGGKKGGNKDKVIQSGSSGHVVLVMGSYISLRCRIDNSLPPFRFFFFTEYQKPKGVRGSEEEGEDWIACAVTYQEMSPKSRQTGGFSPSFILVGRRGGGWSGCDSFITILPCFVTATVLIRLPHRLLIPPSIPFLVSVTLKSDGEGKREKRRIGHTCRFRAGTDCPSTS